METTENVKGDRIRQLRLGRGMTQADLAEATGDLVSKQMISRYERGESRPSPSVIEGLAEAFGVRAADLFREPVAEVTFDAYRKYKRLGKRKQERIERRVERELERRIRLQDLLGQIREAPIPSKEWEVTSPEDAEEAAEALRKRWKLGLAPIANVTEVLEGHHVHAVKISGFDDFDGLSARAWDEGELLAAAVIYGGGRAGERQRLTLAHELAHLALDTESLPAEDTDEFDEEDAVFRMGAAFLAPREPLLRDVGRKRQSIQLQELLLLKEEYGMSIQALLYRLKDLKVISAHHHKQWSIEINRQGWRTSEPEELPPERPKWLRRSTYRAYSEGLISEEKAKQILGKSPDGGESLDGEEPSPTLTQRRSLMELPVEERRQVLAKQAEEMKGHYKETRSGHTGEQGGAVYDYDTGEEAGG
ncbi:helix-turn-helix domain-containing protein [Salinibacter ruber]|uniref:helix-turn-helix domain-containing protein n=1 Tax=Salinibacter ruber TaxID=146919 RepID=UPI001622B4B3|nr:XRE family transcriptional regulator [Salinibacter ruber]MBB4090990.1 Zn-dependent peptidase ImmA (M78 family)/DNA-binding XRE family transcriptional regulator [Salinibacter ruber]